MKNRLLIAAFVSSLLILTVGALAQTQQDELSQMVAQLQKTPTDNALREKIIKLAASITPPPPAVPDEALRREGRGKFAFKSAKTNDDYLAAAKEYEEAVRVAPWINGYYSDLCTIYEKAEDFVAAKRNCEFSLIGLTDQSQINETKQRIASLEFGIEKAAKEKAAAETPEAKEAAFLAKLEGAQYKIHWDQKSMALTIPLSYDEILEIKKGVLVFTLKAYELSGLTVYGFSSPGTYEIVRMQRENGEYRYALPNGALHSFTITADGSAIQRRVLRNPPGFPPPNDYVETYPRQ